MAYDEGLAERIRGVLEEQPGVSEKRMFGGVAFLVKGHMSVGIVQDKLMVRVGPESYDRVLRERHARRMDFTGRPMKGFVYVVPSGCETDADLERWVTLGVAYVASLPAKPPRGKSGPPNKRMQLTRSAKASRRGPRS
jgi:TfoX/Sxy family transcriptional regulator of competence genes